MLTASPAVAVQKPSLGVPADQRQTVPVSLDRIRTALERPPGPLRETLQKKPHFRVEIHERQQFIFEPLYFKIEPVPPGGLYAFQQRGRTGPQWTQPMGGVDLLAIASSIAKGISNVRRGRAEDAAREEVRKALEDFWAAQGKTPPKL